MEIKVLLDKKNKFRIAVKGEDATLCNALKKELWNDKHIKVAGFHIKHPLIGVPRLIVETDGKEDPKKALIAAAKRLQKTNDAFKKLAVKIK